MVITPKISYYLVCGKGLCSCTVLYSKMVSAGSSPTLSEIMNTGFPVTKLI